MILIIDKYNHFQDLNKQLKELEVLATQASLVLNNWYSYYGNVCEQLQALQETLAKLNHKRNNKSCLDLSCALDNQIQLEKQCYRALQQKRKSMVSRS